MKYIVTLFAAICLLTGCVTSDVPPSPDTLRVGITANSQPLVFKQGGTIAGIEADFARKVGQELKRNVVFVEISWDKLIDSLEQNKIDIIMSGMTVTGPRSMRLNFAKPYMQSGMTGLFRRDSSDRSGLVASTIINQGKKVGCVKGTTGEYFVLNHFARADKKVYSDETAATAALKNGRIDMFIHDAPVVWWIAAMNEQDLVAFPDVLNKETLAWGLRKNDTKLLAEVNALLDQWSADGTSQKIISNWIPFIR